MQYYAQMSKLIPQLLYSTMFCSQSITTYLIKTYLSTIYLLESDHKK